MLVTNNNAQQPQAYEVRNLVPGIETLVAQAKVGEGAGTWIIRWGNKEDLFSRKFSTSAKDISKYFTSSVSLYVPGDTPKEATTYRTNLTWILSELPDNQ
ncbi:WxL domain-containing protein [Lactococcus garvieae]